MSVTKKKNHRRMHRIFWAAKTVLVDPAGVRLTQWIGRGPSIRARARLALAAAFMVVAPTLFFGVLRTNDVVDHSARITEYDLFSRRIGSIILLAYDLHVDTWRFMAGPADGNEHLLKDEYIRLTGDVESLVANHPSEFDKTISVKLLSKGRRVFYAVERALAEPDAVVRNTNFLVVRRELSTLTADLRELDHTVTEYGREQIELGRRSLSKVGRDQLLLFLILLFAIPIFIGLVPVWLVAPIYRLKQLARKIEEGRLREIAVVGRDEISMLTKSLKRALLWRESLEQKKSAKIFEMRNVLRAVISRTVDCVLIIDTDNRIDYANKAVANLLGTEAHSLEGDKLKNFLIAPELFLSIQKAMNGDVTDDPITVSCELANGNPLSLSALFAAVHEKDGVISRVVVILRPT